MNEDLTKLFVIWWTYRDRSASGVLPFVFDSRSKDMASVVLKELGDCSKEWQFIEVQPSWAISNGRLTSE